MRIRIAVAAALCAFIACDPEPIAVDRGAPHPMRVVVAWYLNPEHGAVTHEGVSVVDFDTGKVADHELPEYGSGDAQYKLVRVGDDLVFRGHRGRDYGAFAVDAALRGRPRNLGRSWYFVPSATPGRVWLTSLDRRRRESRQLLSGVREVDLEGNVTARAAHPPDHWLSGALTSGLVFQHDHGLSVWDPDTGRTVARVPGTFPVAQHDDVVASCSARCAGLLITDLGLDESTTARPPAGWRFEENYDGSFSPNGTILATIVRKGPRYRLSLVDIPSRGVRVLPEGRLNRSFPLTAWSTTGETVFFYSGSGSVSAYDPATGETTTVSLGADHVVTAIAPGV